MTAIYLPPTEWYETLPTVHASASVLFTDDSDRVLLVKPGYRPYWSLPGGGAEAGEPPQVCAIREIREELGIRVELGPLLVVQWVPPEGDRIRPVINFIFDGGEIADPSRIRLQAEELEDAAFWSWEQAMPRLSALTVASLPAARAARSRQGTAFISDAGNWSPPKRHRLIDGSGVGSSTKSPPPP